MSDSRSSSSAGGSVSREVVVSSATLALPGFLDVPEQAIGIVIFAHGSGSSRMSPRNRTVAQALNRAGIATLLFDLLMPDEEADRANVFDIPLLSGRLVLATRWVREQPDLAALPIGYFGASTGAGAALMASADLPGIVNRRRFARWTSGSGGRVLAPCRRTNIADRWWPRLRGHRARLAGL